LGMLIRLNEYEEEIMRTEENRDKMIEEMEKYIKELSEGAKEAAKDSLRYRITKGPIEMKEVYEGMLLRID
jgi:hypothetical protein